MLQGRNILCMSNPAWKGDYAKTIVEMMQVLGRSNKILYVENPATWLDVFRSKKPGFILRRFFYGAEYYKVSDHIHVLAPGPVLPINFLSQGSLYSRLQRANNRKLHRQVYLWLKELNMETDLIHINAFNPLVARENFGHFGERTLVYYCYDEMSAARYMKKHGTDLEKELLQKAHITMVSSEGLQESKQDIARHIALVKNGVNFDLFSSGFNPLPPQEICVGYLGSIDDRLDRELLAALFKSQPSWRFEFVGRVSDAATGEFLKQFHNVFLAGPHAVNELPRFLSRYSAGIIPFVKNEFTKGIYPLKINEYLATGIPVVLTDFGKMDEFRDIAVVAGNKEEFIQGLFTEIHNDNTTKRELRKNRASLNSWEARASDFSAAIHEYESKQPPQR